MVGKGQTPLYEWVLPRKFPSTVVHVRCKMWIRIAWFSNLNFSWSSTPCRFLPKQDLTFIINHLSFSIIWPLIRDFQEYWRGVNRERGQEEGGDVGLGASVRGGGALHTTHAGVAHPGTGKAPIHRIRQLPDKWGFHTGSFHPLLRSHMHLLVSCWSPRVHGLVAPSV